MPLEARLLIGLAIALAVVHLDDAARDPRRRPARVLRPAGRLQGPRGADAVPRRRGGRRRLRRRGRCCSAATGTGRCRCSPASSSCGSSGRSTTAAPSRRSARVAIEVALGARPVGARARLGPRRRARSSTSSSRAFWIVAVVNAFNLFDNMDGAASSMARGRRRAGSRCSASSRATRGWRSPRRRCAAPALGFLPHNLFASPARIFLGDGGSMPIGFAVAALAMIGVGERGAAWQSLAMGLLFVGIPALDTTLVMVSRRRRGLSILTGGRDHLTHRARARLRTARAVAVALGGAQAVISALAVVALRGGSARDRRRGDRLPRRPRRGDHAARLALRARQPRRRRRRRRRRAGRRARRPGRALAAARSRSPPGIGVSPFFFGYYDAAIWVPVGAGAARRRDRRADRAAAAARRCRRRCCSPASAGLGAVGARLRGVGRLDRAGRRGGQPLARLRGAGARAARARAERADRARAARRARGRRASASGVVVLVRMLGERPGRRCSSAAGCDAPLGYINGQAASSCSGCGSASPPRSGEQARGRGRRRRPARRCSAACCCSRSRAASRSPRPSSALVVLALVPGRVRRGWALVGRRRRRSRSRRRRCSTSTRRGASADCRPRSVQRAARHLALAAALRGRRLGRRRRGRRGRGTAPALRRAAAGGARASALVVARGRRRSPRRAASRTRSTASTRVRAARRRAAGHRGDSRRRASCPAPATATTTGASPGTRGGTRPLARRRRRQLRPARTSRSRATTEDIRQPHSLELQLLSELGLVGAALLALAARRDRARGAARDRARRAALAERAHARRRRRSGSSSPGSCTRASTGSTCSRASPAIALVGGGLPRPPAGATRRAQPARRAAALAARPSASRSPSRSRP